LYNNIKIKRNKKNTMENGNKKLLWLIAIVNILTLILLIGFIVMSWDVITMRKTSQQEIQQQASTSTQEQMPSQTQQMPQTQPQQLPAGGQIQPPTGGQQQPPTGGTIRGKCGDGVCDEKEKANPNLCPQDCK
jgi:cytoskeletal protein RodZ